MKEERRGREVRQLVTCLHKDLSLILEPKVKNSAVVAYMCDPSPGEVRTGPWNLRPTRDPVERREGRKERKGKKKNE